MRLRIIPLVLRITIGLCWDPTKLRNLTGPTTNICDLLSTLRIKLRRINRSNSWVVSIISVCLGIN